MTMTLVEQFEYGLDAPICLTWELTYACNLACVHCLSSSGRRDPDELSTAECKALIDEFERMQIFYVNIGGGEPTVRPDFWELLDYSIDHQVGVKFSTNGIKLNKERATQLARTDYVDVQVSLDGATADDERVGIEGVDHLVEEQPERARLDAEDLATQGVAALGQSAHPPGSLRRLERGELVAGISLEKEREQRTPDGRQ